MVFGGRGRGLRNDRALTPKLGLRVLLGKGYKGQAGPALKGSQLPTAGPPLAINSFNLCV